MQNPDLIKQMQEKAETIQGIILKHVRMNDDFSILWI